ncbi:GTP-binding nuclear protein Ran [Phytophthora nicotianae]|uniref:GTP-binding nuclear protein Ran n=1 Tax=Phytophthora nicotianae TaxID=4792 RepID=A0A0W8DMK7_PHYNI|nr:GTP-binding nuclear protein Ran [Phytophthora nicotianae]
MAFRREVPPLDKMVLKFISKAPRQLDVIINEKTLERAHRIGKPSKSRTHKAKQEVIRALLRGGKLGDDTLPQSFFHPTMTRVEIIGAKISTVFVEMSIDVGGNFNMTISGITKLIEKHPNHSKFTKVHISGHPATDQTIKTIMAKCRKLHSLSVGYCAITDEALIALLKKRESVSRLCLHWNVAITDQLLRFLGSEARNLQELNLCGVKSVSADAIVAAIHAKMGMRNELLDPTLPQPSPDENPEPERKRLKKIDFRYTTVTKEAAASVKERYPELQVTF